MKLPLTPGISFDEARQLLEDSFDRDYALNTGVTHCEMTNEEKLTENSLWAYWADEFIKCRIRDIFGYTLDEFLLLGRTRMQHLCRKAIKEDISDVNTGKRLAGQFTK